MPYNGTFLYVGGYDNYEPQRPHALFYDSIYKFDPPTGEFIAMRGRLGTRKAYTAAFLVNPDDFIAFQHPLVVFTF